MSTSWGSDEIQEYRDRLNEIVNESFKAEPERLLDAYTDKLMKKTETGEEWNRYEVPDFIQDDGTEWAMAAISQERAKEETRYNSGARENFFDEETDSSISDISYFLTDVVLAPDSDFIARWNALGDDQKGQADLVFDAFTRNVLDDTLCDIANNYAEDYKYYKFPSPEDVVAAKKGGTYDKLRADFANPIRKKFGYKAIKSDDWSK